jgi:tRNA threonylcarbamoyladenosine biosynthesis protein TsaE
MIVLAGEAEMLAFGARLGALLMAGDVVALAGDLGAGKTTLARGILQGLGFQGEVPSPTFTIVQTYEHPDMRLPLWHSDLYRLESAAEIEELGLYDVLSEGALLVEWPERLPANIGPEMLMLRIEGAGEPERRLTASVPPGWESRWLRI